MTLTIRLIKAIQKDVLLFNKEKHIIIDFYQRTVLEGVSAVGIFLHRNGFKPRNFVLSVFSVVRSAAYFCPALGGGGILLSSFIIVEFSVHPF